MRACCVRVCQFSRTAGRLPVPVWSCCFETNRELRFCLALPPQRQLPVAAAMLRPILNRDFMPLAVD